MEFVNLTPHELKLNNGTTVPKSGKIAGIKEKNGEWIGLVRSDELLEIENLPSSKEGVIYVVSMPTLLGLRASGNDRQDVVCPITRGEGVIKNKKGYIVSVPGFRVF